jgi:undecaprenyl diphosphate synthase
MLIVLQNEQTRGLHVAIIMDGNGRWAAQRGLPRVAGHRAGADAVRHVIEHASDREIACLTLYAFSSDNWSRPAHEVKSILWLLGTYLRKEAGRMRERGVQLQVIGRRDRIPKSLLRQIDQAEAATAHGRGLHLRVAIDYSSRHAMAQAAAEMCTAVRADRTDSADTIERELSQILTTNSGDVDLFIRTGGEKRLSDFLLWESAYAELFFTDTMWPDFGAADLNEALQDFRRRERRFGGVPSSATHIEATFTGSAR